MNREEKNTQRKRKGMRILAVLLMVVVTITSFPLLPDEVQAAAVEQAWDGVSREIPQMECGSVRSQSLWTVFRSFHTGRSHPHRYRRFLRHFGAGDQGEDPHHQPGSQEGKDRPCHHRLPAIDAECQAHREPRAGNQ